MSRTKRSNPYHWLRHNGGHKQWLKQKAQAAFDNWELDESSTVRPPRPQSAPPNPWDDKPIAAISEVPRSKWDQWLKS